MDALNLFCTLEKLFLIAKGLNELLVDNYSILIHDTGCARKRTLCAIIPACPSCAAIWKPSPWPTRSTSPPTVWSAPSPLTTPPIPAMIITKNIPEVIPCQSNSPVPLPSLARTP